MTIYNFLGSQFSSRALRNYTERWRHTRARAARFSDRTLQNYAVASHLGETLAVVAAAADAPAEILLYDEIGFWGVTAKDFMQALALAGDGPLTLRINSPGGDVFDGLAIYNALRARKSPVTVVVDGLAASAASFIAMAGAPIMMAEQSMLMIHNSQGLSWGDRNVMLDMATLLEKVDGQIGDIYVRKSGKDVADIRALMDDETWLTSTEAKADGLCDAIVAPAQPDAATAAAATRIKVKTAPAVRAAYDPDGDGDDDAAEAIGHIQGALGRLTDAIECLNGTGTSEEAKAAAAAAALEAAADPVVADAAVVETVDPAVLAARQRRLRLAAAEAA